MRVLLEELAASGEARAFPAGSPPRRFAAFALVFAGCGAIITDSATAARSARSASRSSSGS